MEGACPLGKCSAETMKHKPWYHKLPSELQQEDESELTSREKRRKRRKERSKQSQDPMLDVTRSLARRKKTDHSDRKTQRRDKEERLQSLREQRLKREKLEREKSAALLHSVDRSSLQTNRSTATNHGNPKQRSRRDRHRY